MVAKPQRDYAELLPKCRSATRNCLVLVGFFCLILIACGKPPNYTKPDSTGKELPSEYLGSVDYKVTVSLPTKPAALTCNKVYKITVVLNEPVANCKGYNFKNLFDLATGLVANRAQSLDCPANCSPLQLGKSSMRWDCKDSDFGSRASLQLQVSLICPTTGATLTSTTPPDNHNPTPQELTQNDFQFPPGADPTQGADETITQTIFGSRPCPEKVLHAVFYEEKVANCSSVTNYQPFAKKGEDLARAYYNSFKCDTPCKKAAFEVFRQEWDCDKNNNSVVIKTYFTVECRK